MNVLAISASPRKNGNSDVLCDQFLKGAGENGANVSKIRLAEKNISPCVACDACAKTGACVKKDDMAEIQQAIIDADVLVLASPVYFYCMDAQMKMMIDRCLPRHREMTKKKVYFIATAADPKQSATDETLAGFRGFLRCLPESQECGVIYGTGAWEKGEIHQLPAFEQAYQMGREVQ